MANFLNEDIDHYGRTVLTAARKGADGKVVTDVQLTGSNVADGTKVNGTSFEVDENGYAVLRVVDAAPFAYDPVSDKLKVINEYSNNVQEIVFHNKVQHRDIANVNSLTTDISFLSGKKNIYVENTLDQKVTIMMYMYTKSGGGGVGSLGIEVIANSNKIITSTDMPYLSEPLQKVLVQIRTTVAPTTGWISVYMEGVSA